MSGQTLSPWKRQPGGTYLAWHAYWTFEVGKQDPSDRETRWYLKGWPQGNPEASQVKRGFHTMKLARAGVLSTLCSRCMRHREFWQVENVSVNWEVSMWHCRDRDSCQAAAEAREARMNADAAEARKRRDHRQVTVRDTDTGPDLVFTDENGNSWTTHATPADLDATIDAIMAWQSEPVRVLDTYRDGKRRLCYVVLCKDGLERVVKARPEGVPWDDDWRTYEEGGDDHGNPQEAPQGAGQGD